VWLQTAIQLFQPEIPELIAQSASSFDIRCKRFGQSNIGKHSVKGQIVCALADNCC
jgi:hypothetical protein